MSTLRKMSVSCILLAVICAMSFAKYASASPLQNALREAPIGELVMIAPLLEPNVETVCVLQPYQDQLTTRASVAERLNVQLRAQALKADEGHFIFAFIRNHTLELDKIKRSNCFAIDFLEYVDRAETYFWQAGSINAGIYGTIADAERQARVELEATETI